MVRRDRVGAARAHGLLPRRQREETAVPLEDAYGVVLQRVGPARDVARQPRSDLISILGSIFYIVGDRGQTASQGPHAAPDLRRASPGQSRRRRPHCPDKETSASRTGRHTEDPAALARDDEGEHRVIGEQRAHRMQARPRVLADRREDLEPRAPPPSPPVGIASGRRCRSPAARLREPSRRPGRGSLRWVPSPYLCATGPKRMRGSQVPTLPEGSRRA